MTYPMIALTDLSRTYPDGVTALKSVSLRIDHGELVAIVGPSGSGKSTMLNVVGTLDRPSSGTIHIDGYNVSKLSDSQLSALRATTIGFVFQSFHLAARVPALDNVADGLIYTGLSRAERHRRAAVALKRVGLEHRMDHEPHELSGGERQQVDISRPSDALAAKQATSQAFTSLLLGVGAVALLVGGVGVANTMVISVLERRAEIGLRRSLGATRGQIRTQFLAESLLLSALGGTGGVLLGTGVTMGYALYSGWPSVVPAWATIGGLAATLLIGAIAGLYPAIRASRLSPTEALSTP
nr:ATP-binding cassette domain-containing protein [Sphaerisporangium perillae]